MRTAIVHYWLLGMRGGEKVLEALCRLLPDADLFTLFYDPERVSPLIRSRKVTASFLNPLRRGYRSLLPLMPLALESMDLRGYDLIVSSESGPAKGVLVPAGSQHICYCHSPMRYLWDLYPAYLHEWTTSRWKRAAMAPLANYLRLWDFASAARVDQFVANSANTQARIWRSYRRESSIVYPPVSVERFYWKPPSDYFLIVSELVAYKRIDTAVRLFTSNGRKLRIAGGGPEYRRLRSIAGPSVEFCGRVPDSELLELYAGCRALIMPGEEDFGLTPVEALASGKPVIAFARGGVLESVPARDPLAGVFYESPDAASLGEAIRRFDAIEHRFDPCDLQLCAGRFSERNFTESMRRLLPSPDRTTRNARQLLPEGPACY